MKEEQVFVFDDNKMDKFVELPGLSTNEKDIYHLKYGCATHGYFTPRTAAEKNEHQKQIIPYIIVRRGKEVLAYMRSKKSGEGRLHNKWSVGVGGHINPVDLDKKFGINGLLSMAMGRELTEELEWAEMEVHTVTGLTEFGILYDDADEVGRVHIGYIAIVDVPEGSEWPQPKENTIADSKWISIEEASQLLNLEGWSRIVLEAMSGDPDKNSSRRTLSV